MDVIAILRTALLPIVTGIMRALLLTTGTWLATKRLIDESAAQQLTGLLPIALASIVWAVIEKYAIAKWNLDKINIALALPANSTSAHLDEAVRQKNQGDKKNGNQDFL